MRRPYIRLALFVFALLVPLSRPAAAQEMQYNQGELIRSLLPSVVNVTVRKTEAGTEAPNTAAAAAPADQDASSGLASSSTRRA